MSRIHLEYPKLSAYLGAPDLEFFGSEGGIPDAELLSSGRAAIFEIARHLAKRTGKDRPVLHIPEYLCPALTEFIEKYFDVRRYFDAPGFDSPRFDTIQAKPQDAVLAVNFFGHFNSEAWRDWKESNPEIFMVSDHSHAPFSPIALSDCDNSDYTFASFRKVLPLCGAFLRIKNSSPRMIFKKGRDALNRYEAQILAASLMKQRLNNSSCGDWKDIFNIFEKAERLLEFDIEDKRMSFYAYSTLSKFNIEKAARIRARNFRVFANTLGHSAPCGVKILNIDTLKEPFGVFDIFSPVLLFATHDLRNFVRAHLRSLNAEPPVFWAKIKSDNPEAKDISARIMTLPLSYEASENLAQNAAESVLDAIRMASAK